MHPKNQIQSSFPRYQRGKFTNKIKNKTVMDNIKIPRRQQQHVVYLNFNGDDKIIFTSAKNYKAGCIFWADEKKQQYPFLDFTVSPNPILTHPRAAAPIELFAVVKQTKFNVEGEFILVKLYESVEEAKQAIYDIWYASNNGKTNSFGYADAKFNNGCLECYHYCYPYGYHDEYSCKEVCEFPSDTYSIKPIKL